MGHQKNYENKRTFLCLLVFLTMTTLQTFAQESKTTIYKGNNFTLEYPDQWDTTNENGILNFFPKENYGALTFSYHAGVDLPSDRIKQFILAMYERKDNLSNIKMTMRGDVTEFFYEHSDKDRKWITKVFTKKTDFYLLTINCELDKWELNRDSFMSVINSFKIN